MLAPAHIREVLIAAGVKLLSDDGTTVVGGPADDAPIVLIDSTIERLSAQAETQSGTLGAVLDDLGGGAPMALPLSVVLAAYAIGLDTPGSDIARAAMAGQDLTHPKTVVFPTIVHILFAADAVHELGVRPASALMNFDAGVTLAAFKPCSAFHDIVFGTINKVFDWLKIPDINVPKTGLGFFDKFVQGLVNIAVDGINIVVEAGRQILVNAARLVLSDLIDLIATAATIAALVGTVLSHVQPLSLTAVAAPPLVLRGTSPVTTVVTLTATTSGFAEWPDWLNDCAVTATHKQLPPLKPVGSTVNWTPVISAPIEGLLHRSEPTTDTLQDLAGSSNTQAKLTLEADPESAERVKGEAKPGIVRINIGVHRTGLDLVQAALVELAQGAASTLTRNLPQPLKGWIDGLIAPAVQGATSGFTTLLDVRTYTFVDVIYHGDRKPSPSPTVSPSPSARTEHWTGVWASTRFPESGTFTLDVVRTSTSISGTIQIAGSPCVTSGRVEGTINGNRTSFGQVDAERAIQFQGTIDARKMSGTYLTPGSPPCNEDVGTWSATR